MERPSIASLYIILSFLSIAYLLLLTYLCLVLQV